MKEISQIINGRRVIVKKPELLAPAGNLEKLKIAIIYGADAVFIGGKEFSLRSAASNFTIEDIKAACDFAKEYGAKIHVTTNIIFHNENLEGLEDYLETLDKIGVTAVIAADPYVLEVVKKLGLSLEVHLSTQMSLINHQAVNYAAKLGYHRVVLGREVSFDELRSIIKHTSVDIEYFIHGAMCIHYSGRCMLSNHFSKRDANRGGCSQSCRWNYALYQGERNLTEQFDLTPFSMSSKDLALITKIPQLIELGVDSFKIEGRMKSVHYIATVVGTYRRLIDDYCADPDHFLFEDSYQDELMKAANRETTLGFFSQLPDASAQLFSHRDEHPTQDFIMQVINYDEKSQLALVFQRNYFAKGEQVEFFGPNKEITTCVIEELYDEAMQPLDIARHPMQRLYVKIPFRLEPYDMARRISEKNKV